MSVEFQQPLKAAVTVAEMARMVGLSRARFYQLMGSAFPFPVYHVTTRRPIYVEELQNVCLEVRRRNCGIDGKPVMFYARRLPSAGPPPISKTRSPKSKASGRDEFADVAVALKSLGMSNVSAADVRSAVSASFPKGTGGIDQEQVIRAVFLRLKRQNSADNVG
jgi:hypothetical protein